MNEIAKAMWDISIQYLDAAQSEEDVSSSICYTGIAECALKAAQFAVNNPFLVGGEQEAGLPPGAMTGHVSPLPPVPQGPTSGPQVWGAPR